MIKVGDIVKYDGKEPSTTLSEGVYEVKQSLLGGLIYQLGYEGDDAELENSSITDKNLTVVRSNEVEADSDENDEELATPEFDEALMKKYFRVEYDYSQKFHHEKDSVAEAVPECYRHLAPFFATDDAIVWINELAGAKVSCASEAIQVALQNCSSEFLQYASLRGIEMTFDK